MDYGSLSSSSQGKGSNNPDPHGEATSYHPDRVLGHPTEKPEQPQNPALTPTSSPAPPPTPTATDEVTLEVMAYGTVEMLNRPCVDCGRITGSYCDYCLAEDREEDEEWAAGQHTPLCTHCDRDFDMCHFCRRQLWARQPAWGQPLQQPPEVSPEQPDEEVSSDSTCRDNEDCWCHWCKREKLRHRGIRPTLRQRANDVGLSTGGPN